MFVGTDEYGNTNYRYVQPQAIDSKVGAERRWVVYNGDADASVSTVNLYQQKNGKITQLGNIKKMD